MSFAVALKVDRPVACIIGAGPAGLALGHVLRQARISCVVLERQETDGLRARMKAGMLEHRTVELLRAHGLAQPILERGRRIGTCEFRADGTAFILDYAALCGGRGHHIYPQQELVADWAEQLVEAGGDIRFGVEAVAVDQREDGAVVRAFVAATGSPLTIDCELVVCCDGAGSAFAAGVAAVSVSHPFRWLTLIAAVPPSSRGTIYGLHPRGFAGQMHRSPTLTRFSSRCRGPTASPIGLTTVSGRSCSIDWPRPGCRRSRKASSSSGTSSTTVSACARACSTAASSPPGTLLT